MFIFVVIPVFAGQVVADLAESVSNTEIIGEMPSFIYAFMGRNIPIR